MREVGLVSFTQGRVELCVRGDNNQEPLKNLKTFLKQKTMTDWLVVVSDTEGDPSLQEQEAEQEKKLRSAVERHSIIQKMQEYFGILPLEGVKKVQN